MPIILKEWPASEKFRKIKSSFGGKGVISKDILISSLVLFSIFHSLFGLLERPVRRRRLTKQFRGPKPAEKKLAI